MKLKKEQEELNNSSFFLSIKYNLLMIKKIVNYIKDNTFKINYVNNTINIVNYDKILEIKDNVITIVKDNKNILIKGKDLKLTKLLDNEILINGIIKNIEM